MATNNIFYFFLYSCDGCNNIINRFLVLRKISAFLAAKLLYKRLCLSICLALPFTFTSSQLPISYPFLFNFNSLLLDIIVLFLTFTDNFKSYEKGQSHFISAFLIKCWSVSPVRSCKRLNRSLHKF